MRYGLWGSDGEALRCDVVASFTWIGLGALFSTAFLRIYRAHDVLVRQDGGMWPVVAQVSERLDSCLLETFSSPMRYKSEQWQTCGEHSLRNLRGFALLVKAEALPTLLKECKISHITVGPLTLSRVRQSCVLLVHNSRPLPLPLETCEFQSGHDQQGNTQRSRRW